MVSCHSKHISHAYNMQSEAIIHYSLELILLFSYLYTALQSECTSHLYLVTY